MSLISMVDEGDVEGGKLVNRPHPSKVRRTSAIALGKRLRQRSGQRPSGIDGNGSYHVIGGLLRFRDDFAAAPNGTALGVKTGVPEKVPGSCSYCRISKENGEDTMRQSKADIFT